MNKRSPENEPASIESQERLIEIMNDSPRVVSFNGTSWEIKALKPGTQWLIAQEAISIAKAESANYADVIKQFSINIPSVVKVITLALLNDRKKIFANEIDGKYSDVYEDTYRTILWDTEQKNWIPLLVEVINMLDIECFFTTTSVIQILRQRTLERRQTAVEQKQSSVEQNGVK